MPELTAHIARHNLPAEPNDFIGRARDLDDLGRLLGEARVVTLCGPGGIGKTRLALRVAAAVPADAVPDGVWLVDLAGVLPERGGPDQLDVVVRLVALAVGVIEEEGQAPLETLVAALRARRLLLVLDNSEHVVASCATLCQALLAACPRVRILVTGREPLRISGENVWRVPPLELPGPRDSATDLRRYDSVRLFEARAAAVRPGFAVGEDNAAAVRRLCRALDGVPLAIELAAARLRMLSADEVAHRLGDRFRLLTTGSRTAPARQRTLRAAIDWSHGLLDEPERILLRRLSVFTGWTLDLAERVCRDDALPAEDVLDLLAALVDKSLVVTDREVAGEMRFRMLDSIREYAAERLAEAGEETEVRRRHRDCAVELVEAYAELLWCVRPAPWSARIAASHRFDAEQDNLRAALAWSLEHGDIEEGLRILIPLRAGGIVRGEFAEWTGWMDRFLAAGPAGVPTPVWARALVGRSQLAIDHRDFQRAHESAEEGLRLCREVGDRLMAAAALCVLAQTDTQERRYDTALARLDEAIELARSVDDALHIGLTIVTRGAVMAAQGRLREAQQLFEEGLQMLRAIEHDWGAARALFGLGQLAHLRGDLDTARACYEKALPALRQVRAAPDIARCQSGIAKVAMASGDLPLAREALGESLSLSRDSGVRLAVARTLETFAELTALEGDPKLAVRLSGAAAALRDAVGRAPLAGARLEKVLQPARKQLGEHIVAHLWGEGRALSPDEAVTLALSSPSAQTLSKPSEPRAVSAVSTAVAGTTVSAVAAQAPTAQASSQPAEPATLASAEPMTSAGVEPTTPPSTLTPREWEIALLIARGASNRGIADELVISPATVARHVSNILTKLGFTSRAQIAAWAVDRERDG